MSERPNVLLILTEEQRLSTMSAYGTTPCLTPSLDGLAEESVVFENAYTSCPVCSPARATIMTGMYPHNHGVTSNAGNVGCRVSELPDGPALLSRALERSGYALGYTGKWHLGTSPRERKVGHFNGYLSRRGVASAKENPYGLSDEVRFQHRLPRDVGFEGQNFAGHGGGGFAYPEYQEYLRSHGYSHELTDQSARGPQRTGVLSGPLESIVGYFLTNHTIDLVDRFCRTPDSKPFFIWHNFWGPHAPYYVTRESFDLYREKAIPEWPSFRWPARETSGPHQMMMKAVTNEMEWDDWEEYIRYYYAFMTMIDSQIGRLLDHLKHRGILENTIVIFVADHGEALGSHGGIYNKGQTHFEEVQRIPLRVRVPGSRRAGTRISELVGLCDLYPTICDLTGTDYDPARCDGRTVMPLLRGDQVTWRDSIGIEYNRVGNACQMMRTIRKGSLKYGFAYGTTENLYDLKSDPHELNDRAREPGHASALADMREERFEWMDETADSGVIGFHREYVELVSGNRA